MVSVRQHRKFTLEEYLRIEREAQGNRCELIDGEILAMTGGTARHSKVAANAITSLTALLRGKPCQAFTSDLRLLVKSSGMVTYPDVLVVCGRLEFHAPGPADTVLNPTAIFEILSPSTESFDRGDKLAAYRTIPSVKHVVLVSQDAPQVELHTRQDVDSWTLTVLRGHDASLALPSLGVSFPLGELYRDLPST